MWRRWRNEMSDEWADAIARRDDTVTVAVPARRAGTARRRMRWAADTLRPYGYSLQTFDPVPNRATGRFGVATFGKTDPR